MTPKKNTEITAPLPHYSNGMEGYATLYDRKRDSRYDRKRKRAMAPGCRKPMAPLAETATDAERALRLRIANHTAWKKHWKEADRVRATGRVLRSETHPILKRFVQTLPKRGRLRVGRDKTVISVVALSKLISLDWEYVEGNREFLAWIRIDLDAAFLSFASLENKLRARVSAKTLACMPHIIVGAICPITGMLLRPHLIFMLPRGHEVWKSADSRCRRDPLRLFDGVARGIAASLMHLGADYRAPSMSMRVKNPCCEKWSVSTPNDAVFPSLDQWKKFVPWKVRDEELARSAAQFSSGLELKASNELFNELAPYGRSIMRKWNVDQDPILSHEWEVRRDRLQSLLELRAVSIGIEALSSRKQTRKMATWLVDHFDPDKCGKAHGAARHLIDTSMSTAERQKVGGAYAAGVRSANRTKTLGQAAVRLATRGVKLTMRAVAGEAGASLSTVQSNWASISACYTSVAVKKVLLTVVVEEAEEDIVVTETKTSEPVFVRPHAVLELKRGFAVPSFLVKIESDIRENYERQLALGIRTPGKRAVNASKIRGPQPSDTQVAKTG